MQLPSSGIQPTSSSILPLGPAARALVKKELGALPSQQQQKYWELADLPYNVAELAQLVEHYLLPYIATRHVAHQLRSGRGTREAQALVRVKTPRIQQHYPVLAPVVLQLHAQVEEQQQKQEQQQQPQNPQQNHHQQQQQQQQGSQEQGQEHVSSRNESPTATPSERLLLVLRCLRLWGKHQANEQQLPSLLQTVLHKGQGAGGGACLGLGAEARPMEDSDIEEVVDLTNNDGEDDVPQELLEAFLAGECEVMLVREVLGNQGHVGVKPDLVAAADGKGKPWRKQDKVCQKRGVDAIAADGSNVQDVPRKKSKTAVQEQPDCGARTAAGAVVAEGRQGGDATMHKSSNSLISQYLCFGSRGRV